MSIKEDVIREAIREAIKIVDPQEKNEEILKETLTPTEKEHLTENKKRLNEELLRRWGYTKRKGNE